MKCHLGWREPKDQPTAPDIDVGEGQNVAEERPVPRRDPNCGRWSALPRSYDCSCAGAYGFRRLTVAFSCSGSVRRHLLCPNERGTNRAGPRGLGDVVHRWYFRPVRIQLYPSYAVRTEPTIERPVNAHPHSIDVKVLGTEASTSQVPKVNQGGQTQERFFSCEGRSWSCGTPTAFVEAIELECSHCVCRTAMGSTSAASGHDAGHGLREWNKRQG